MKGHSSGGDRGADLQTGQHHRMSHREPDTGHLLANVLR